MKVYFLTQTGPDGPASRYRVYQYIPYLTAQGVECTVSPGIREGNYERVYARGNNRGKFFALCGVIAKRLRDAWRIRRYDVIFLQREIFPQTFPLLELLLCRPNSRFVFDFDDAIFLVPPQRSSVLYGLRYKSAVQMIIRKSKCVIAGNSYLGDYARQFNNQVYVVPTVVDANRFRPATQKKHLTENLVIGWIGTEHTLFYLRDITRVFRRIQEQHKFFLHTVGVRNFTIDGVEVLNKSWREESEVEDLHCFDIGVAPLRDDAWGRGKCGLKVLQYMACGVACICSNAGVFREMIRDGENGFLADTEDEWADKLGRLLADENLRRRLSLAARRTVEERYSLAQQAPKLLSILTELYREKIC